MIVIAALCFVGLIWRVTYLLRAQAEYDRRRAALKRAIDHANHRITIARIRMAEAKDEERR